MATYLSLLNFTDKGIREVKDTLKRTDAFKKMAKDHKVSVKEALWLQGQYDIATIIEAPDEATATALLLSVAKLGNVRSQTLRAFTAAELENILGKVA